MPKLNISRSITINTPIEQVFEKVSHFKHWTAWSPWLILEPEAVVTVAKDGQQYQWKGQRTGEGNMQITQQVKNQSVDYDLQFIKPFKSQAKVRFELEESADGTKTTWIMDSSLPWFLFWMKKSMEVFVGMDYERGLAMLKDYTEEGEVHSKLSWRGVSQFEGGHYVGIRNQCTIDEIDVKMKSDFDQLLATVSDGEGIIFERIFSLYHKFDPVKNIVDYTAGIGTQEKVELGNLVSGYQPPAKIYTVEHIGPYHHIGNAWSALNLMIRNKEIKVEKGKHPWESYLNDPDNTPPNELLTHINFVVK